MPISISSCRDFRGERVSIAVVAFRALLVLLVLYLSKVSGSCCRRR